MYTVDVLVQGYPGKALFHGGLGWSTIALLRGEGRVALVDVGAFGVRKPLLEQLRKRQLDPADITDVILTHAHYDHAINFTLFPNATVWIGSAELTWAAAQPPGFNPLPELYVQELARSSRVRRVEAGDAIFPGFTAIAAPGHTPGHLLFYLTASEEPVLFTGDAAKNRAELLSMDVNDTADRPDSIASLRTIWEYWKRAPNTLLIPGHDLSMRLDDAGKPVYVGERQASIGAWFSETLTPCTIDLCCSPSAGLFTNS